MRRNKIRILSFSIALGVVLLGYLFTTYRLADKYNKQLGYTYEHGLTELSEHLNNIDTTLTKGIYAGTAAGASKLAMSLWSEAGAAKACLSSIPSLGTNLDNTYKFLSQVGEYSLSLSTKLTKGEQITEEERDQLKSLSDYSKKISQSIDELCVEMNDGRQWSSHIKALIDNNYTESASSTLYSGFNDLEDSLKDFPTLLYDGPFSDHIMQAKPLFLENKKEITVDEAKKAASDITGLDISVLLEAGEEAGIIPCYNFSFDNTTISITKMGGYCSYLLNSRDISDTNLGYDECISEAKKYLDKLGLGNFKESYYSVNEGVCVINFSYLENDIVYYTDLIKIGVALDNGEIVSFNSQGFIMNHTERKKSEASHTINDAEKVLSPLLSVQSRNTAVIPLDTREEQLCYEFVCKGQNDDEIIVYVNANSLDEEKLFILLKTDGGVLTI